MRPRADGRKKNIVRCTECLTALWSESLPAADYVTVYAGTLDDSPKLVPDGHLWTQDAQPWIVLPKEGLVFEQGRQQHESFDKVTPVKIGATPLATVQKWGWAVLSWLAPGMSCFKNAFLWP